MPAFEYAVDVWETRDGDHRLDARELLENLNSPFGNEGWELVWMALDTDLADHDGRCHLRVFKRAVEADSERSP